MSSRLLVLLLAICLVAPSAAQTKKTVQRKGQPAKTTTARKTATPQKSRTAARKTTTQSPSSIKGLQNQRQQIQKQIQEQERRLQANKRNVRQRLQNLMMLNTEIRDKQRTIDTIRADITSLDKGIALLDQQIAVLENKLSDRKQKYIKSMRYLHRNRSVQSKLMFVFSARNFNQMYRRARFMRDYAAFQRAQGEAVIVMKEQVELAQQELAEAKTKKRDLLRRDEMEHKQLEGKQSEQQKVVSTLQKEQKTIESLIAEQRKKDADLNAQIDRLIAQEVARAKARAEAEAKKAAGKRRNSGNEATGRRRNGGNESGAGKSSAATKEVFTVSTEDRLLSDNFESNRGRLPMPVTGAYRIVSHFGQYNVEGLKNVILDNKGINVKGQAGASARSIFDGEVSAVVNYRGTIVVMVRHGSYISVYCNLSSVNVRLGQHVNTRQVLGGLGSENILQFQLRRGTAKLNPESWLGR